MNKKAITLISVIFALILLPNLASAVIFNISAAREEEWERYKEYREDYIQNNDLEAFSKYISERNLQSEFGFRPASYYYIPPSVLAAKYNPPLQGVAYSTENRGYTTSLNQPSAVQYYGEKVNGRYTGYISSKLGSTYFDHPQINGGQNYLTGNYQNYYSNYNSYNYGYNYGSYGYDYSSSSLSTKSLSGDNYGIYSNSGHGNYYSGFDSAYGYGYGYGSYQYLDAYDINTEEPAHYARIVEPLSGGYYVVGFY